MRRTIRRRVLASAAACAGLAGLLLAQDGGFRFDGPLGRIVTPNGDKRNDELFLCFGNPSDSEAETRIFTLWGAELARPARVRAALAGCPAFTLLGPNLSQHSKWDGRSNGETVKSGVYVYQVKAEGRTYTGTLLVVR